jgi:hypothetical protein
MSFSFSIIATFGIIKLLFTFLGWYTRDHQDLLYRRGLDRIFDNLQTQSVRQIFFNSLLHLVSRLESTGRPRFIITKITFWLSIPAVCAALYLVGAYQSIQYMFQNIGRIGGIVTIVIMLAATLGVWVFSQLITFELIKKVALRSSITVAFFVILLEILVTQYLTACALAYLHYFSVEPSINSVSVAIDNYLHNPIPSIQWTYSIMLIMITAAWLTVCYIVIVLISVLLKIRRFRDFTSRSVYLVTTDSKPIMSQLGTLLGTFGAIAALFVS